MNENDAMVNDKLFFKTQNCVKKSNVACLKSHEVLVLWELCTLL